MKNTKIVEVIYFTDVLCIWAYLAQIRIDELKATFGSSIVLKNYFISVFGSVESKMKKNGVAAYSQHVQEIASGFPHIEVHPEIWRKNTPTTSVSCHTFLKAIHLLEARGEFEASQSVFEEAIWAIRVAFFKDLVDVSDLNQLMGVAASLNLPLDKIENLIQNGEAFAALDEDAQIKDKYGVSGSPTLVLNEGRQKIYGNVGYRVIEVNVQELLNQPDNQASWC